jgi:hypothetical protein
MATTVRPAFQSGQGGHFNVALDVLTGITLNTSVALGVGSGNFGMVEAFLPNNKIKVRMMPRTASGSIGPILKKGSTVS